MSNHKDKAIEIYTKMFMRDKVTPFSKRMKKAKKEAIDFIEKRFNENTEPEDLLYWDIVKKYAEKI